MLHWQKKKEWMEIIKKYYFIISIIFWYPWWWVPGTIYLVGTVLIPYRFWEVISVNDKGLYYAEFSTKNGKLVEDEDFQKIENVKEAKIKRFIKAYDKMAKKSKDMEPNEY